VEFECHGQRDDDDKRTSDHRSIDTWMVRWLVLASEHSAANNATDATSTDQSSGAEGTLPLATDVVCLVRENTRDVGVASDGGKEDAEITDAIILREAKEWEACKFVIRSTSGKMRDKQVLPIKRRTPSIKMNGARI
jgi:hypothetical protein